MNASPLDRHLLKWRLSLDGDRIERHTSWLSPVRYRGSPAMLKVLKPQSDEENGADVLRYFDGAGAVRLIDADEAALLLERVDGNPALVSLALSGGDEDAADILAETVKQLHSARNLRRPQKLVRLRDWFQSLFVHEAELPILRRCADVARRLMAEPREDVVLHGDLHHANVLCGPRGWLAIDPKGLSGERSYEVANLLGNPEPHGEIVHDRGRMQKLAVLYADRLGLDVRRVLGFALAHAGLAASWSMEDGGDPSYRLRCAEILDELVVQGS